MIPKRMKWIGLVLVAATFFTACQKEVDFQDLGGTPGPAPGGGNGGGGTNNTSITGEWNFIGSYAETYASLSFSEAGTSVKSTTTSDYITENNAGSLTITGTEFQFKGITHTVEDTAHSQTYIDGVLFDETDAAFNPVYPPTDNNIAYVRNANDSITFTNAIAFVPDMAGGGPNPVPAGPMGAKIYLSNDTLTVNSNYETVQTAVQQGIPVTFDIRVKSTMRFKKK